MSPRASLRHRSRSGATSCRSRLRCVRRSMTISSARTVPRWCCPWRCITTISASCAAIRTVTSSCKRVTSCSSDRPAAVRRSSPRRWPRCSTCRLPLRMRPRSPRPAMSVRMWRTSCSSCCRRRNYLYRRDRQDRPQEREHVHHARRLWRGRAAGTAQAA